MFLRHTVQSSTPTADVLRAMLTKITGGAATLDLALGTYAALTFTEPTAGTFLVSYRGRTIRLVAGSSITMADWVDGAAIQSTPPSMNISTPMAAGQVLSMAFTEDVFLLASTNGTTDSLMVAVDLPDVPQFTQAGFSRVAIFTNAAFTDSAARGFHLDNTNVAKTLTGYATLATAGAQSSARYHSPESGALQNVASAVLFSTGHGHAKLISSLMKAYVNTNPDDTITVAGRVFYVVVRGATGVLVEVR